MTEKSNKLLISMKQGFNDPTIDNIINNGFFNGTVLIATETTLDDENKGQLISLVTILSMKLASLWEIKEQYKKELKTLKA